MGTIGSRRKKLRVTIRIVTGLLVPQADDGVYITIPEILNPPFRSYDCVVPPVVRRIMALLIGTKYTVIKFHIQHADVFHVYYLVQPLSS